MRSGDADGEMGFEWEGGVGKDMEEWRLVSVLVGGLWDWGGFLGCWGC